jgi:hypothetical protein
MAEVLWSLTEHRGPEGLRAIEPDWRRLYNEMPDPAMCHSHEVYSAYVAHICPAPESFRCFALSDGDRVRAILPLEERREHSFVERGVGFRPRVWGMPWCEAMWITDAIGPEDDARRALLPVVIEHLRREPGRPAILVLGRGRDASVLWDGLDRIAPWARFVFSDGGEYVVPTDMTIEAFNARLSSRSRNVLHKASRAFEDLPGAARVRTAHDGLLEEYERFIAVEASGWKGRHGSAIAQLPALEAFLRDLLVRLTLDGRCEIHALHAEGRCIASGFYVFTGRQCAALKSGYDESYARVSPGRLRAHQSLEWCCESPEVDSVSEMSDAPWLRMWLPETNGMRRAYVSLRPVSGALLLAAFRFRYGPVRRTMRAIKAWKKSREDKVQPLPGRDSL